MPVLALSGNTKKYVIGCSVSKKKKKKTFIMGFNQGGYLIWSDLILKRYNKISSVLREDNGFSKNNRLIERRRGTYIVIRYLLKCRSKLFIEIVSVKPDCTGLPQTSALIAS